MYSNQEDILLCYSFEKLHGLRQERKWGQAPQVLFLDLEEN